MRITSAAVGVLGVLAVLAGCGGSDPVDATAEPSPDERVAAGCPNATEKETEELYVRALYDCDGNRLYVFNTSSARDSWSKIATEFGSVELRRGDRWLLVKP